MSAYLTKSFGTVLGPAEIENALSDAAYNAWRFAARFDSDRGTLKAWFLKIAHRAAQNVLRSKKSERHADLPEEVSDDRLAYEEKEALPDSTLALLRKAIEMLPPLQRAIIEADLAAQGQADSERLANRHETTVNSIYVSRNKALHKLYDILTSEEFMGGES